MNWRKEAIERLRSYESLCYACRNIPLEIRRLEVEAQSPPRASVDRAGGKGGGRREDKLLNNIISRQLLQWSLEHTRLWVKATSGALECLGPEEKLILQRLYIYEEQDGLDRLCQELGVERSSIYRYRDQALEKFTVALFGENGTFQKVVI